MKVTVHPSGISGTLRAPSSKSMAIRLVAAAMLAKGTSRIYHPSSCDDALAMKDIARQLGAEIQVESDVWKITGGIQFKAGKINCGESGLAARLMIALASLGKDEIQVNGLGTLLNRHLGNIETSLNELGVKCKTNQGKLPFFLKGPMCGENVEVDGSGGSQFVSGLLLALPLANYDTQLHVKNLKSIPYIDMTLEVLDEFGISIHHNDYQYFTITGNQHYKPINLEVEGDWSGAAFLVVAAALAGNLTVTGLDISSSQADMKIMSALARAGVRYESKNSGVNVFKSPISPFEFDATHCPDIFPPLAVLAAAADGVSKIKGVNRLAQKESNRGLVLKNELAKLGVRIELEGDVMLVHGGKIKGGEIFSHHDHRIAMAGAVAGLIATGPVKILHPECVSKSYPGFFSDMKKLGIVIENDECLP